MLWAGHLYYKGFPTCQANVIHGERNSPKNRNDANVRR